MAERAAEYEAARAAEDQAEAALEAARAEAIAASAAMIAAGQAAEEASRTYVAALDNAMVGPINPIKRRAIAWARTSMVMVPTWMITKPTTSVACCPGVGLRLSRGCILRILKDKVIVAMDNGNVPIATDAIRITTSGVKLVYS